MKKKKRQLILEVRVRIWMNGKRNLKEIYGQTEEVYDDETVTIKTYYGIMRQVTTPLGET